MNQKQLHRFYAPVRQAVMEQLGSDDRLTFDPDYHGGFAVLAPNLTLLAFVPCGPGGSVKIVKGKFEALKWPGTLAAERALSQTGGFVYPDVLTGATFEQQGDGDVQIRALFLNPIDAGNIFVEEAKQLVH